MAEAVETHTFTVHVQVVGATDRHEALRALTEAVLDCTESVIFVVKNHEGETVALHSDFRDLRAGFAE